MKLWKTWTVVLVVVVFVAGIVIFLRARPLVVKVEEARKGTVIDAVYATGEVEAMVRAEVASEVSGRVVSVEFDAGDTVGEGAVLAFIESNQLDASMTMAEEALNRAKSSWDEAKKELKRREQLFRQKIVTEAEYDGSKRAEERARAEYNRTKAALEIEKEQVVKAEITSPMGGLLVWKGVDAGEYATPGRPLFRVIDPASLQAVVDVDEAEVVKILPGQVVRLSLDAYPGETFECEVERVIPRIDEVTKTAEVRVNFKERPDSLQEGMSSTVNIITRRVEDSLLVPREAVTLGKNKAWVYVVEPDRTIKKIEFSPGAMDENKVEIRSGGIESGMRVVLDPAGLEEGMEVRIGH